MKVTLVMAVSNDWKIAKDSDHFPDWTGSEDKKLFKEITKKAGSIIMGSKTYQIIEDSLGKPLPGRKNIVLTRQPRMSCFDNLEYTNNSPEEILSKLEKEGYKEVVLGGGGRINSLFAQHKLITHAVITVCEKVEIGEGLHLFSGNGIEFTKEEKTKEEYIADGIRVEYYTFKK